MNTLGFFCLDDQEKLERFSKKAYHSFFLKKYRAKKRKSESHIWILILVQEDTSL